MAKTQKTGRVTPKVSKGASGSPTPVSSWKSVAAEGTLITVPSGNTALVRTPGMQAFLQKGVIPNGLMSMISETIKKGGEAADDLDTEKLLADPEKLNQIMELADSVTVYCCMDPRVHPAPRDENGEVLPIGHLDRDTDTLYVDEVDFNDKMFIFNFVVGGTADLSAFRGEQVADVGDVQPREDVELPAVSPG